MNYTKQLPESKDLQRLSQAVTFPVTAKDIVRLAESKDCKPEVVNLVKLFHGSFESQKDFYTRTTELVMLIKEEREQPEEVVFSTQD